MSITQSDISELMEFKIILFNVSQIILQSFISNLAIDFESKYGVYNVFLLITKKID